MSRAGLVHRFFFVDGLFLLVPFRVLLPGDGNLKQSLNILKVRGGNVFALVDFIVDSDLLSLTVLLAAELLDSWSPERLAILLGVALGVG